MTASELFSKDLKVLNIGPTSFADELRAQNADVTQVAWKPIAGGNPELLGALASLDDAAIDAANQEALSRYLEGEPYLIDYSLAKDVIPGMEDHMLLHAGPPITWDRMCGPMKGAIMGAIIFEGWAKTPEEAEQYAASGKVKFSPCHEHSAVGPMAGVIAPHMVVSVFENRRFGNRAYCPVPEGMGGKLLRYGAYSQEVIDRLHWIQTEYLEVLRAALAVSDGGIDTKSLQFQALHMGDEGHNRNKAGTSMFLRAIAPLMMKSGLPAEKIIPVYDFINGNDGFYLSISMPTSKVTLDPVNGVKNSTMVTAMARNGVDFGIRVAGLPGEWFVGPAQMVDGLYFPGYGDEDANPDMGDSSIRKRQVWAVSLCPEHRPLSSWLAVRRRKVWRSPSVCTKLPSAKTSTSLSRFSISVDLRRGLTSARWLRRGLCRRSPPAACISCRAKVKSAPASRIRRLSVLKRH